MKKTNRVSAGIGWWAVMLSAAMTAAANSQTLTVTNNLLVRLETIGVNALNTSASEPAQAKTLVTSWSNQAATGTGQDFTQTDSSLQPLLALSATPGGKNAVRFDGANDYLQLTDDTNLATGTVTWFIVFNRTGGAASATAISSKLGDPTVTEAWGTLHEQHTFYHHTRGAQAPTFRSVSEFDVPVESWHYASAVWNNTAADLNGNPAATINGRLDGLDMSGNNSPADLAVTQHLATFLGCSGAFGPTYWGGDIAAVLIYDTALSPADVQVVEGYLNNLYLLGTAETLPVTEHLVVRLETVGTNPLTVVEVPSVTTTNVTSWNDLAALGGGQNATDQGDPTLSPVLVKAATPTGKDAVQFDGVKRVLTIDADPALSTNTISWFMVFKFNSIPPGPYPHLMMTATAQSGQHWGSFWQFGVLYSLTRADTPGAWGNMISFNNTSDYHLVSHVWNGSLAPVNDNPGGIIKGRFDGATMVPAHAKGDSGAFGSGSTHVKTLIGDGNAGPPGMFDGQIAAVLIYNTALSSNDVAAVEAYLNNTYIGASASVNVAQQPMDVLALQEGPVTFSVTAEAINAPQSELTYQWQRDGVNIPGATNATYTTPSLSMADNGAQFRVLLSLRSITITSHEVTFRLSPAAANVLTVTNNLLVRFETVGSNPLTTAAGATTEPKTVVKSWINQAATGAGRDFTQDDPSRQPLLARSVTPSGKDAVRFDGAKGYLKLAADTNLATGPWTWFIVFSRTGGQPSATAVSSQFENSIECWGTFHEQGTFYHHARGAQAPTFKSVSEVDVPVESWHYASAVWNNTDADLNGNPAATINGWLDGVAMAGNNSPADLEVTQHLATYLGCSGAFGPTYWGGDIAAVLIYNSALSAENIQAVETYLNNQYIAGGAATLAVTDHLVVRLETVGTNPLSMVNIPSITVTNVTSWNDQAGWGGSQNATDQGDPTLSPVLAKGATPTGNDAVQFDGAKSVLKIDTEPALSTNTISWFLVFKFNSMASGSYPHLLVTAAVPNSQYWGSFWEGNLLYSITRASTPGAWGNMYSFNDTRDFHLVSHVWNGSQSPVNDNPGGIIKGRLDGATMAPAHAKGDTGAINSGPPLLAAYIGDGNAGAPGMFDGQIAAVLIYDTALSALDVAAVEAYLKNTYISKTPASVTLNYTRADNQLTLSWVETGFVLQENNEVNHPTGWTDVIGGTTSPVTVSLGSAGQKFYRLRQQ